MSVYVDFPLSLDTRRPLWPSLLADFPPSLRTRRSEIAARLHRIRVLRNRVFHHEPVWRGVRLDERRQVTLAEVHDDILAILMGINPAICRTAGLLDRFPDVYAAGPEMYLDAVELLRKAH